MNLFKRKLTAFTAMLAFLSLSSAVAHADMVTDYSTNTLGKVGVDLVKTNANRLDVNNMTGNGGVAQWDIKNGNLDAGNHLNYGFSGLSQTTITRVLGGETSKIMGKVTSSCLAGSACSSFGETGRVLFINPAGVLFGQGSQVDVNSFTTSTFDMKGARNIQNMTASELANYQNNVLNKASAVIDVNGTAYKHGFITLDSNYTAAFSDAGIANPDQMIQNSSINLDGATFTHYVNDGKGNFDFNTEAANNTNKSVAFVSNNINYKDSVIRTGLNYNYVYKDANGNYVPSSYSNVKLITADGVTFDYLNNGYINDAKIAENDNHPTLARTITMDNAGLIAQDASKAAIVSGDVDIIQNAKIANGNQPSVKIKDTIVKGVKLVNWENGDIEITASQDIAIDHSRLETDNSKVTYEGTTKSTTDRHGGEVRIKGDKDVTINDSTVITSGSEGNVAYAEDSGATTITAGNNANVKGSKILSDGHTKIKANNKVNIDNSIVQAYNTTDKTTVKDVTIVGKNGIDVNNTDMNSKGNVNILAVDEATGKYTGDINITSDNTKSIAVNDANQPVIYADKALNIKGKNTTVDNTTLAYSQDGGLNFHDSDKSGSDYTNNVTIKNNTAFSPMANGKIAGDVTIETNGDLTFDNATAQRAQFAIKFDRKDSSGNTGYNLDSSNSLNDDGSIDGIHYQTKANPAKVDAKNLNIKSTNGDIKVTNGSKINATNNSTVTAENGKYTQNGKSTMSAGNDISITAAKNVEITQSSTAKGGNDAKVKSTKGNLFVDNSEVLAIANNASLDADAGSVYVNNNAKVEAANDASLTAKNNVSVLDNSKVIAGSDSEGFDVVKDANDTIGDANITAKEGSVFIKNNSKVYSQDKDVNITAKNDINFGNKNTDNIDATADITAKDNVNIKSTAGNITGEKTTMPTIKYGDRLTFDAAKDNVFTSQDSLKSVNVDYKAGGANKFYTQGDNQFVNSTLEAPNNFIESGKDVILNNLEIKQATDKPEDTVTEIYANGNVTTYNVTGENLGAKDAGDYHTYPQSVSTDRVAKGDKTMPEYVKGLDKTPLNVNDTKLKVTTDTVKDPSNPDNGSITLVLQNADNTNAGVELTARNVKALDKDPTTGNFKEGYYKTGTPQWDENINPKEGPEIVLDAADGKIAIKELYSDKLTLDPNDKMFADNTDGTPVITVKDQGGLNLDPTLSYDDGTPDGFTYDKNYDTKDKTVTGGDLSFDDWTEWKPTGETWTDPDGTIHTIYESTRDGRITDRITTQTDQRHTITFDNEGNPGEFTLVYDKTSTTVEPGRDITAQNVKDDPTILDNIKKPDGTPTNPDDFIKTKDEKTCPPTPDPDRNDPSTNDVSLVTLPREQLEVSRTSTVVDDTADQTSNIMSAAARVDLGQEIEGSFDDDSDDDDLD